MKNEATDKAVEQLTGEQKKTWQEMTGEKFDFQFQLPHPVPKHSGSREM